MSDWIRACDTNSCVEVHHDGDRVLVRNSAHPELVVEFTREEWQAFLDGRVATAPESERSIPRREGRVPTG